MKLRFTFGALLAVMAALLVAFACPALAKGGGGRTPVSCASFNNWSTTVESAADGSPRVVVHVGVLSTCLDEGIGAQPPLAVGLTTTDTATGAWLSADVKMTGYGQRFFDFSIGAPTATPPARTLTFTVTRPNGQLQDIRTTTLAEVMQTVLAAQPAA